MESLAGEFSGLRAHLISVAYRLTGSVADTEDAVQESWLRLSGLSEGRREEIRELAPWLTTVVSRICVDRLRSATARRETYVGQWLPEPIVRPLTEQPGEDPLDVVVRDDGVRMAAMVVLDRLTPEQRVAFVLHDAFGVSFAEIADILGCTVQTARQHGSRGRRAVAEADPPDRAAMEQQRAVLEQVVTAFISGDMRAVTELLHPDAVLVGDSDGKAKTTRQIMRGADKIVRFFQGLRRMYLAEGLRAGVPVLVNGDLGFYLPPHPGDDTHKDLDAHLQTFALREGKIVAIYDQANPDKLTRVMR
ncbi:MAG: RNA polymerase sigma factor SigJ [Nocardia sp.]|nr:RNA polymerase sigma factor SigJ [Nocardia sp.]